MFDVDVSKRKILVSDSSLLPRSREKTHGDILRIKTVCESMGLSMIVEDNGYKGRHGWVGRPEIPEPIRTRLPALHPDLRGRTEHCLPPPDHGNMASRTNAGNAVLDFEGLFEGEYKKGDMDEGEPRGEHFEPKQRGGTISATLLDKMKTYLFI